MPSGYWPPGRKPAASAASPRLRSRSVPQSRGLVWREAGVILSWTCLTPLSWKGVDARAHEPSRGSRTREKRLARVQALFLCLAIRADDHDGFAHLAHALHHMGHAW